MIIPIKPYKTILNHSFPMGKPIELLLPHLFQEAAFCRFNQWSVTGAIAEFAGSGEEEALAAATEKYCASLDVCAFLNVYTCIYIYT